MTHTLVLPFFRWIHFQLHKTLPALSLMTCVVLASSCGLDVEEVPSASSPKPTSPPNQDAPQQAFDNADGIKGGQMYSKFWAAETGFNVSNSSLSDETQLAKITGRSNFFRCKQCHGWDRLGREGGYSNRAPNKSRPSVANINLAEIAANATPEQLFNRIKKGTANRRSIDADLSTYDPAIDPSLGDQMPDYSQIFTDAQIWDLVKYLKQESLTTGDLYQTTLDSGVYPSRNRTFTIIGQGGDAAKGDRVFANNCARCHGPNGAQILVDGAKYTVGAHTREKPYEAQHKVKFGHLGSNMGPILAKASASDIRDLFKALSNTSTYPDNATDIPFANGINGGRLYSKFWATETGFTLQNSALGNDQTKLDAITTKADFFRCKQCHGWDRLGREGGYSNRAPKVTRPNVADFDLVAYAKTETTEALFNSIKIGSGAPRRDVTADLSGYDPMSNATIGDQMPNYAQILTDKQIWDLVQYLKVTALDTSELYTITLDSGTYPLRERTFGDIGKDGDSANGRAVYAENCSKCHGSDGTLLLVDGGKYSVGQHVRLKPYEDQHKVKFGHLGSTMWPVLAGASTEDIRDLMKALTDTISFPDKTVAPGQ